MAFKLHRAGHVGAQPEIAAHVFVERRDFAKGEPVARRVGAKVLIRQRSVRKKFDEPRVGGNPNPLVATLKKLENPVSGKAVLFVVHFGDEARTRCPIRVETKEARDPGRRPKPPMMILQKVMNRFVR